MENEHFSHMLSQIKKVDPPPFLLTRIRAQIQNNAGLYAPPSWKWAGGFAFALLLGLNLWAFQKRETPTVKTIAAGMHLLSQNQIYNE